jgi:predicted ester cyclase
MVDRDQATVVMRRIFVDGFSRGDFNGLHAHIAEDYIDHSPLPAPSPGPAGFEARMQAFRDAFGDLDVEIDDVSVDGDRVWFRWAMRGHHIGSFAGIKATDRPVLLEGMNLEIFDGDQIVEHYSQFDRMGLVQQLTG